MHLCDGDFSCHTMTLNPQYLKQHKYKFEGHGINISILVQPTIIFPGIRTPIGTVSSPLGD